MRYFESYQEIKKLNPSGHRDKARAIALDGLVLLDKLKGIEQDLAEPRIQFLYIHHVFKDEEKRLDALLKRLSKNHHFISYSAAVEKLLKGDIDKPYIAISSDDGFKNNIRAAEILNDNGAQACFFINPAIIDETDYEKIRAHCKERLNLPPIEFLNWNEVEQLQKMGHEIGSHTMNHIDVANSTGELITDDCRQTVEILTAKCGGAKHFAFPYGRFSHFNDTGRKAVFDSGFISCASAERGCHINADTKILNEELCILRDHVIVDWPIDHIFYFLAKNSRQANFKNNFFPYNNI